MVEHQFVAQKLVRNDLDIATHTPQIKNKLPWQFPVFALSRFSTRICIGSLLEGSRKPDTLVVNTISTMVLLSYFNFLGQSSTARNLFNERTLYPLSPDTRIKSRFSAFHSQIPFNFEYPIEKSKLQGRCFPVLALNRQFPWLSISQIELKFLYRSISSRAS